PVSAYRSIPALHDALPILQLEQRGPVLLGLVERRQDPDRALTGLVGLEVVGDHRARAAVGRREIEDPLEQIEGVVGPAELPADEDRKSTRLNSSHVKSRMP